VNAIAAGTKLPAFVLLLLSTSTWAEWTRIDNDDAVAGYVDLATIRKQGHTVEMSSLLDFKSVQRKDGRPYLSLTVEFEINCDDHRSRILAVAAYSGNMGQGEVVITETLADRPWEPIRPRSRSESLWQIACKHKAATRAGRKAVFMWQLPVVLGRLPKLLAPF
jgi:hypothetical protein